jgi:hypothetical protein
VENRAMSKMNSQRVLGILILFLLPNFIFAGPVKKLRAEINFSDFIDSQGGQGISVETRIAAVEWANLKLAENQGSIIQIHIFSQNDDDGTRQELLSAKNTFLGAPVDRFVLESNSVYSTMGSKTLFVNLSVRENRSGYPKSEDFENLEFNYSYKCTETHEFMEMVNAPHFSRSNIGVEQRLMPSEPTFGIAVDMNAEQFRRIKKSEHSIQLKLFVYRGVDKFNSKTQDVVKLPIGRSTPLVSARPVDIAIPLKSLCNEAAIYWADIYGSEMELSCEISVFH